MFKTGPIEAQIQIKRRLRNSGRFFYLSDNGGCEYGPSVEMTANEITVGCTTVTRAAIEEIRSQFELRFPKGNQPTVKLQ